MGQKGRGSFFCWKMNGLFDGGVDVDECGERKVVESTKGMDGHCGKVVCL